MKMTFRWYGENDPVTLEYISQIPHMSGVVSAVYDVPVGEVWSEESINRIKEQAAANGLEFEVVESVPVHEDIKLGAPGCEKYIENYCENIRRLAKAGVKCICYNFMPVFDWLRSDLAKQNADGSNSLAFDNDTVLSLDPVKSELSLPGWDESYTKEGLRALMEQYKDVDEDKLWENFARFINAIIPVCEECDVDMAIHPDDPPWGIFGLPRIITGADSYRKMHEINPSRRNGITFCTGSLGANPQNDLIDMIKEFGDKIHFFHARNIKITGQRCFQETGHYTDCGSLNMYGMLKALHDGGFTGYIRPDHGRMIWGEQGRAGYGLYDRALGAAYLNGLWEAIEKGE
ncbi:MAG: mannonate dehydratase [Clostridia bacterium]|nr:mannonate dehydratase [Clostridia bacterium]